MISEHTQSAQARSFNLQQPNPDATGHLPEAAPDAWYVVYTRPRQESIAALNLQQQHFEIYLPRFKTAAALKPAEVFKAAPSARRPEQLQEVASNVAIKQHLEPPKTTGNNPDSTTQPGQFEHLFPRYVFFRPAQQSQSISTARSTRGVATLVSFGGHPARVGDDVIGAIRQLEQRQHAGASEAGQRPHNFKSGQAVRLRRSALDGLSGLVTRVAAQRVQVLIELLGREKLVMVNPEQLELA